MKHCDQCGEDMDYRDALARPGWVHTGSGSQYCTLGWTNGKPDRFSADPAVPCLTEGCLSNAEYEAQT